jgi:hypothetical protein
MSCEIRTINVDLSYNANDGLSFTLYGLLQEYEWDQDGTTSGGSGAVTNLWTTNGEDTSDAFGASLN